MALKIQMLIPHYHESEALVCRLLDSIAMQQGIDLEKDVGVIICNDGTDVLLGSVTLESKYPFEVRYMVHEHSGVSATRNILLDHATAEYVMCCDADDTFSHALGLYKIFETIDNNDGFDMLTASFFEELYDSKTGKYQYIERQKDPYFVHAKVFRRDFLTENHIQWAESLKVSGDNYFLWQAIYLAKKKVICKMPIYIWKHNPDSICRCKKNRFEKDYYLHIISDSMNIEDFLKRGMLDVAKHMIAGMIYDLYLKLEFQKWNEPKTLQMLQKSLIMWSACYQRYKPLYDSMAEEAKRYAMQERCEAHAVIINDRMIVDAERLVQYMSERFRASA